MFQAIARMAVLGPDVRATGQRATVPRLWVVFGPGWFDDTQPKSTTQQLLFGAGRDLHWGDAGERQYGAGTRT